MANLRNINVYLAVCAISLGANPISAFFDWRCTPVEPGEIVDDTVQLQAECSENSVMASWQSGDGVGLIHIEYQCYPVGETPTGVTTVLESFSMRTTHSESFPVSSSENATLECVVLGCYFDDFFYEEHPIASASCIINGTDEPSPSPTSSSSSLPLTTSLASPSPVQPSDCDCDCNRIVVTEHNKVETPSPRNNGITQRNTLTKRDIKETSQETEYKGATIELITLCVFSTLGLLLVVLLTANILLVVRMKNSRKCNSCYREGQL